MRRFSILTEFKEDEILITEEETRVILKFLFADTPETTIDVAPMTTDLRGFAQALLITAIDATYSVGFVEGLFRATANPTKGALKAIKSFAKKATKHWFTHASASDLADVKIYEFVRDEIARRFKTQLVTISTAKAKPDCCGSFVTFDRPAFGTLKVWG